MVYTLDQFVADGKKNHMTPEQMDIINKERIKKWGTGINGRDQLYQGFKQQSTTQKTKQTGVGPIAGIAIGVGAGSIASFGLGKGLEKIGSGIYGLGLPKVESQVRSEYKGQPVKTVKETSKEYNLMGTNKMVGEQSYKAMKDIADNKIRPARKILDSKGPKISYNIVKNNAIQAVNADEGLTPLARKNIIEDITNFFDNELIPVEGKTTTYENLNKIKSSLDQSTSVRTVKGNVPLEGGDAYKKYVAGASRETIYDGFKSIGVDTNILQDYGNMKTVFEKSVKAGAKDPIGGILGMQSEILKTGLKPGTTILGRGIEKTGKLLQQPLKLLKGLGKGTVNLIKGAVKGLASGENLMGVAQDSAIIASLMKTKKVSETEARKMLKTATNQLLQLPGESIVFVLDKALGLPQTKESEEYRRNIKRK